MQFRTDLEGLRGLAVLAVMLLHFNVPSFTGGYIGVDIFFVLSGYLISSLILHDIKNNNFSYLNFYNRRIKRLIPATLLVVAVTVVVYSFLLLPNEYISFMRSVREVLLFNANNYFAKEVGNYFSTEAEAIPLLHTWSLAIEWQFYFIFPIVFLTLARFSKSPQKVIACFLVLALGYSVFITDYEAESVYYSTTARAFEFLMGTMATFILPRTNSRFANIATYTALFLLLVMAFIFNAESSYPGTNAFFVSLATFVILVFGRNNRLLSNKLLTNMGKLSYSAYLWHWPIAVMAYHLGYSHVKALFIPLIMLTILLSHLTFRWVEQPVRQSGLSFRHSLILLIIIPIIGILSAVYQIKKHDGFPQRLGSVEAKAYNTIQEHEDPLRDICHVFTGDDIETCSFGEKQSHIGEILLIGDSHGLHIKQFVEVLASAASLKAYIQTESECLMLPDNYQEKYTGRDISRCSERKSELYQLIDKHHFDYVILSERWLGYSYDMPEYKTALMAALNRINNSSAIPVIIMPVAEGDGTSFTRCFYRNIDNPSKCNIARKDSDRRLKKIYTMFGEIRKEHSEVRFINPQDVQCSTEACLTQDNNIPLYEDSHHIYDYTAEIFARWYLEKYGNPFKPEIPE
ncbi:acyltransferase family protein [Endozoicomonas sp. ALE010]|uniref:acyltransferase family protein n=1 Tax=Endozoicomonas sp. ALE010 TaxID=3403081 RepID=UPI003BB57E5E